MRFHGNYNAHLIIVLISMGFLVVVLIYINMQRECWNRKVCAISTSTQNPGARKPVHAGTGASQNSKSRSATADRLNSLLLDFFNGIAYDISVETQDGCHYTYLTLPTDKSRGFTPPFGNPRYEVGSLSIREPSVWGRRLTFILKPLTFPENMLK